MQPSRTITRPKQAAMEVFSTIYSAVFTTREANAAQCGTHEGEETAATPSTIVSIDPPTSTLSSLMSSVSWITKLELPFQTQPPYVEVQGAASPPPLAGISDTYAVKRLFSDETDGQNTHTPVSKKAHKRFLRKHIRRPRKHLQQESTISPVIENKNIRLKRQKTRPSKAVSNTVEAKKHTKKVAKIKSEAARMARRHSTRCSHKKGFYSQSRLEKQAWAGSGAACDPIYIL
jgi:hypothetical protein